MKKEEEEEIYITKEKEMDKQGKAISAKKWYIRQEAVIFFFFVYLIICWVRLKKLKSGFFCCCCFRHGTLSLWLGLGFTFLCSGFYHKESWKFEI